MHVYYFAFVTFGNGYGPKVKKKILVNFDIEFGWKWLSGFGEKVVEKLFNVFLPLLSFKQILNTLHTRMIWPILVEIGSEVLKLGYRRRYFKDF